MVAYSHTLSNVPSRYFPLYTILKHFKPLRVKVKVTSLHAYAATEGWLRYRGADKSLAHLLPVVFCLIVRIFRLMLVLFYIYM